MKKTIYVYRMTKATAANGSEYDTIDGKSLLLIKARTIQEVKDILDKRANYKDTSTKKIPTGNYEFMFNGRNYKHTPEKLK